MLSVLVWNDLIVEVWPCVVFSVLSRSWKINMFVLCPFLPPYCLALLHSLSLSICRSSLKTLWFRRPPKLLKLDAFSFRLSSVPMILLLRVHAVPVCVFNTNPHLLSTKTYSICFSCVHTTALIPDSTDHFLLCLSFLMLYWLKYAKVSCLLTGCSFYLADQSNHILLHMWSLATPLPWLRPQHTYVLQIKMLIYYQMLRCQSASVSFVCTFDVD